LKKKFNRNNQIADRDPVLVTADKMLSVAHSALRAFNDDFDVVDYHEEFKTEFLNQVYELKDHCDKNGIENGYPRFSAVLQHVHDKLSEKYTADAVEWLFDFDSAVA
jgi:hypothetical protein